MPRSLLDTVDLARVRAVARGVAGGGAPASAAAMTGPAALALSCLVVGGALQHDPDDPSWVDRDRLVIGGRAIDDAALLERVATGCVAAASGGDAIGDLADMGVAAGPHALAVGLGMAAGSALDGGVWRVYAVLHAADVEAGETWEAACAAADMTVPLTVVVVTGDRPAADRAAALLEAAGWPVARAGADDPAALLGALDRAVTSARPYAIVGRP